MTATQTTIRPEFGDPALIAKVQSAQRIEYDDDDHIIGSSEWYEVRLAGIEEDIEDQEATIEEKESEIEEKESEIDTIKGRHTKELATHEEQLDAYRDALHSMRSRLNETEAKYMDAPCEADLLDIWPIPPYGTSLLADSLDDPEPLEYGAPLQETERCN